MSCSICKKSTAPLVKVKEKGLLSLIAFSQERNENSIYHHLVTCKDEKTPVFVHEDCRKWFNNKRRILTVKENRETKKTRRSFTLFNWKENCFFCGSSCVNDVKNPSRRDWHIASTLQMRQNILDTCTSRLEKNASDEWALQVQTKALDCIDFVAAEARYHRNCRLRFETTLSSVKDDLQKTNMKGRKTNEEKMDSFLKAYEWLETEASIHTMSEFKTKVQEVSADDETYDSRYLKKLLKDHYGAHISFSDEPGRDTLIYFVDMANFIINKKFRERKEDILEESERIIRTAANLIRADIREKGYNTESYPTSDEIQDQWIPESLRIFMSGFTESNLKQESIG